MGNLVPAHFSGFHRVPISAQDGIFGLEGCKPRPNESMKVYLGNECGFRLKQTMLSLLTFKWAQEFRKIKMFGTVM